MFNKFPGNPALFPEGMSSGQSNYLHKNKPFRIAEVYLNLAEAYASANQTGLASNILNSLRAARISGYSPSYSQSDVMNEIKDERVRELMGEGFRIQDLKRFGRGFTRTDAQVRNAIYQPDTYTDFEVSPENGRFIFPIPQAEIDANPNIAGQQNPEY